MTFCLFQFDKDFVVLLTGTPIQNNLKEVWSYEFFILLFEIIIYMKLEMCGCTNYPPIPWMVLGNSEGVGVSNTKILYRPYENGSPVK